MKLEGVKHEEGRWVRFAPGGGGRVNWGWLGLPECTELAEVSGLARVAAEAVGSFGNLT